VAVVADLWFGVVRGATTVDHRGGWERWGRRLDHGWPAGSGRGRGLEDGVAQRRQHNKKEDLIASRVRAAPFQINGSFSNHKQRLYNGEDVFESFVGPNNQI
jgi:hypothetical protein